MSIHSRVIPIDIVVLSALTVLSWISTGAILHWTSKIYRSIELYELGLMLMSDRMKYFLYQRTRTNMTRQQPSPIQQGLLFFPRPDFSHEITPREAILRSQSVS